MGRQKDLVEDSAAVVGGLATGAVITYLLYRARTGSSHRRAPPDAPAKRRPVLPIPQGDFAAAPARLDQLWVYPSDNGLWYYHPDTGYLRPRDMTERLGISNANVRFTRQSGATVAIGELSPPV